MSLRTPAGLVNPPPPPPGSPGQPAVNLAQAADSTNPSPRSAGDTETCGRHAAERVRNHGRHSFCNVDGGCGECVWCPVQPSRELTACALSHYPRHALSANKLLGNAYKAHLRKQGSRAVALAKSAEVQTFLDLQDLLQVGTRYRKPKPWPVVARDKPWLLHGYKNACVAVGDIMCPGQGRHLHRLACAPKKAIIFDPLSRLGQSMMNLSMVYGLADDTRPWFLEEFPCAAMHRAYAGRTERMPRAYQHENGRRRQVPR